jgi:hypothetical protein
MEAPRRQLIQLTRRAGIGGGGAPTLTLTLALALTPAVAGCGGSSSSTSTTAAPAGSVAGRDGGFTTVIPTGFVNGLAALLGGPITLQYAALAPKTDGLRANINVAPQARGFSAIDKLTLDGAAAPGRLPEPSGRRAAAAPVPGRRPARRQDLHGDLHGAQLPLRRLAPGDEQVLAGWRWK